MSSTFSKFDIPTTYTHTSWPSARMKIPPPLNAYIDFNFLSRRNFLVSFFQRFIMLQMIANFLSSSISMLMNQSCFENGGFVTTMSLLPRISREEGESYEPLSGRISTMSSSFSLLQIVCFPKPSLLYWHASRPARLHFLKFFFSSLYISLSGPSQLQNMCFPTQNPASPRGETNQIAVFSVVQNSSLVAEFLILDGFKFLCIVLSLSLFSLAISNFIHSATTYSNLP